MKNVTWLASYPKSGNTWTRAFLAALTGDASEVNINGLGRVTIASGVLPFEFAVGMRVSDLTEEEIETLRPAAHQFLNDQVDGHYFLKVHDAYIYTKQGVPLFPTAATRNAVYLLRNPLDVAVSWANHSGISIQNAVNQLNNPNQSLAFRLPNGRLSSQLRQRMLTWGEHVLSWVDAKEIDVLPIRYEDLKHDAVTEFSKIAQFSGLTNNRVEIEAAEEKCRFEKLKQQEAENGFNEKSARCNSFFKRGRSGYWKEELTESQVSEIIAHQGKVMKRFGYLDDQENPL